MPTRLVSSSRMMTEPSYHERTLLPSRLNVSVSAPCTHPSRLPATFKISPFYSLTFPFLIMIPHTRTIFITFLIRTAFWSMGMVLSLLFQYKRFDLALFGTISHSVLCTFYSGVVFWRITLASKF